MALLVGCSETALPVRQDAAHPFSLNQVRYLEAFEDSGETKFELAVQRLDKVPMRFGIFQVQPFAELNLHGVAALVALEHDRFGSHETDAADGSMASATREVLRLADALGPGKVVKGGAKRIEIRYGDPAQPTFVLRAPEAKLKRDGAKVEFRSGFELETAQGNRITGRSAVLGSGARLLAIAGTHQWRTPNGQIETRGSRSIWLSSDGTIVDAKR